MPVELLGQSAEQLRELAASLGEPAYRGAQIRHPLLYLTVAEAEALDWIDQNTPQDALVLASPEMGLFIPAHTLRRVIYGHPFETVNGPAEEQAVRGYFEGTGPAARDFLAERGVDYVIYGPREAALGPGPDPASAGLSPVFEDGAVIVYRVVQP